MRTWSHLELALARSISLVLLNQTVRTYQCIKNKNMPKLTNEAEGNLDPQHISVPAMATKRSGLVKDPPPRAHRCLLFDLDLDSSLQLELSLVNNAKAFWTPHLLKSSTSHPNQTTPPRGNTVNERVDRNRYRHLQLVHHMRIRTPTILVDFMQILCLQPVAEWRWTPRPARGVIRAGIKRLCSGPAAPSPRSPNTPVDQKSVGDPAPPSQWQESRQCLYDSRHASTAKFAPI